MTSFTRYASLEGKVVIVTGGASGIGEAFVRGFSVNRARVAFLDIQEEVGTALVEALAHEHGVRPLFVACDLTDIAALREALETVRARLGPAAALVNNAANDQRQDFASVSASEFDWTMAVNLRHAYFAAQAVVPQMRERGGGSIINMSSVAWMNGVPDLEAYAAAKAAMVGFTNSLARRVGLDRIRVNAIAPAMVITERQRRLWYQDEGRIAAGLARQCLPDMITPEDVAKVALFLAADDSAMLTKQCLVVSGGSR
ncbi:SDR family oxidoreductase [Roseomonas hellenica]|uniref:SDR family oxidoreductase n=1 Tax=Plastoroseomonas hellenica TaxID=2687306 RepID=A0ABS5EVL3_9PROT|nr:SDR family oxidoreductase [Plastoroseomonas hellenica]MBR0664340.1 SDR family oxidoreductase [Plastoroseomonas hellenica]